MNDTDLQAVYRESVLEHSREPHNFGRPADSNRSAEGFNPLCGDKVTVYMTVDSDNNLSNIAFEGSCCAISMASASMMTEALKGTNSPDADKLIASALGLFSEDEPHLCEELEDLRALEGVRSYPSRIKCATLAWTAALAALHSQNNQKEQVTTE